MAESPILLRTGRMFKPGEDANERAVGITAYVDPEASGFECVIKHRYTDFLVNEILPNGEVLHLTASNGKKRKRDENSKNTNGAAEIEAPLPKRQQEDLVDSKAPANGLPTSLDDQNADRKETVGAEPSAPSADTSMSDAKDAAVASISEDSKAVLIDVFGERTTLAALGLYASVCAQTHRKPRDYPTINSEPIAEKSKRTEAHTCIRRIFDSKLETVTVQDQDQQSGAGTLIAIRAAPANGASSRTDSRQSQPQRGKQDWSDLGGEFLHFTLYKENKDTMEVLGFLSSQLKLNMKHFSFAGTKDRRGVTVQRVAVHRERQAKMESLNRLARGWRLGGPWEYKPQGLDLGMLTGNEFVLTLRDTYFEGEHDCYDIEQRLENAESVAEQAAWSLNDNGFLNYYGLQRFGTHTVGTHVVGLKMLKGDLKGAVDAILTYDPSIVESDEQAEAGAAANGNGHGQTKRIPQDDILRATAIHSFVTTGTSAKAFSALKAGRFQAEKNLMVHLAKQGRDNTRPNETDFQGALMQIQRNLRLMYVHAYQGLVWNTVVSKRWERYGRKVVEGDLVVVGEKERREGVASEKERREGIASSSAAPVAQTDEDGDPIVHASAVAANGADPASVAGGVADDQFVRARPLSKEEAESGRYTIFDVVLTLPGFDVIYPKNEIGRFYEEFMASDAGGGLDPHDMRRGWKDISLSGGYRKIMARPLGKGVEAKVMAYSGDDEQLVETDLEKVEQRSSARGSATRHADGKLAPKAKIAVLLKLQLGSSQYATMALRELTKGGALPYRPDYSSAHR